MPGEPEQLQPIEENSESVRAVAGVGIRAECFLLCDGAAVAENKLFILGGGWDRLGIRKFPEEYVVTVAVKLAVPTSETYRPLPIRLEVQDDDRNLVVPEPMRAELEMARPPGYEAHEELPFLLPIKVKLPLTKPQRLNFVLYVDNNFLARASLRVIQLGDQ